MAAGSTYVSGLISGIDTSSLISQLLAIERRPVDLLRQQVSLLERKQQAYQEVNTALLDLRDKATALSKSSSFDAVAASSSNPDLLSATATDAVPTGTYDFTVLQTASKGSVISNALASADTPLTSETGHYFRVSLGGNQVIDLAVDTTDTLNTLSDRINAADAGVTAFVLNDGTGYRLVVQSDETGAANSVTVDQDIPGMSFDTLSTARDAQVAFGDANPVIITSSDNVFRDVVPGLTLTIRSQVSEPTPVTVDVARDVEEIKGLIRGFVDSYNRVVDTIAKYNTYNQDTGEGGPLFNEVTIRNLQADLTGLLSTVVSSALEETNSLPALGITADKQGRLSIDDTALDSALQANYEGVRTLFADASEGLGLQFKNRLEYLTRPGDGVIFNMTNSLDEQISYYDTRIDDMEDMLALKEDSLRKQFAAMEEALAGLQSQSQFLSMHLGNVTSISALLGG